MMMNTVQDPSFRPSALFYQCKSLCKKPILKTNISIAWIVIKLAILLMSSRKRIDCSPNVSCYFLSHRARIGLHCGRWCWGSDQVSSTESVKYFAWCGLDFRIISWSGQVVYLPRATRVAMHQSIAWAGGADGREYWATRMAWESWAFLFVS